MFVCSDFENSEKIIIKWNIGLMALSYVTAALGTFSALDMLTEARSNAESGLQYKGFVLLSSASLGVSGIWCMHFIGMIAADFNGLTVTYEPILMILSAFIAMLFVFVAMLVAMRHDFKQLSMNTSNYHNASNEILFHDARLNWLAPITKQSIKDTILSGILLALGVGGMHYSGMASMHINAIKIWNWYLIGLTVLFAIVICIVGVSLLVYMTGSVAQMISANIIALAACGLHYSAMYSITHCTSDVTNDEFVVKGIEPNLLVLAITGSVIRYLVTAYARYRSLNLSQKLVDKTDVLLDELCEKCAFTQTVADLCVLTSKVDVTCLSPKTVNRAAMMKRARTLSAKKRVILPSNITQTTDDDEQSGCVTPKKSNTINIIV